MPTTARYDELARLTAEHPDGHRCDLCDEFAEVAADVGRASQLELVARYGGNYGGETADRPEIGAVFAGPSRAGLVILEPCAERKDHQPSHGCPGSVVLGGQTIYCGCVCHLL